ncbi:hypothetical protein LINPERPRIM_LOCUS9272 [Linum perenne]
MRERELGRERGSRGVGERGGVVFSGGSCVQDRLSRDVQIRGSRISFSRSLGRFGSAFKLEVARNASSHFIFLELLQLQWLEGVFKVASGRHWVFPSMCESSSQRRCIAVCRRLAPSDHLVRISEKCPNGKLFFVDIPADQGSVAWLHFLKQLQCCLGSFPSFQAEVDKRSFAEVVSSSELPERGSFSEAMVRGDLVIEVGSTGVKARVSFLERCLVFRFSSEVGLSWTEFRKWANRSWGVPVDSSFHPIGDDVWLLVCASAVEVRRVLALKRWTFGDFNILMDRWIADAGRSSVLLEDRVGWVIARGFPLHLRSTDLFKSVGDRCGGFLKAEQGSSLSSVRLKIKLGQSIPEEILLRFGSDIFPIRIDSEGLAPVSPSGPEAVFFQKWKAKGKLCGAVPGKLPPPVVVPFPECSSSATPPLVLSESLANSVNSLLFSELCQGQGNGAVVRPAARAEVYSSDRGGGEAPVPRSVSDCAGMSQIEKVDLCLSSSVGPIKPAVSLVLGGSLRGQKPFLEVVCAVGPKSWADPFNSVSFLGSGVRFSLKSGFSGFISLWPEKVLGRVESSQPSRGYQLHSALLEESSLDSEAWPACNIGEELLAPAKVILVSGHRASSWEEPGGISASDKPSRRREEEEECLLHSTKVIASVIGLSLKGNAEEGLVAVGEQCKEVCRRKSKLSARTSTDRELKRLGVSPEVLSDLISMTGRNRCVGPLKLPDEF